MNWPRVLRDSLKHNLLKLAGGENVRGDCFVCLFVCLFFATKLSLICLQFTETLAEMLGLLISFICMYSAFEGLIEVYNAFIND